MTTIKSTDNGIRSERFLPRFPNHEAAHQVDEVTADISADDFRTKYVDNHRPCVIRGAARDWPAVSTWTPERIRERVGTHMVGLGNAGVIYEPIVELGLDRMLAPPNQMGFDDFLDEVRDRSDDRIQLYSEHLVSLGPLAQDLGPLDMVDTEQHPPQFYGDRFFMSQRGYTDWHIHYGDETMTAQVRGSKEFLLLPPDKATFSTMFPMARRGVWKTPQKSWPADFAELVPWRVVLEPGDAVYIPMHWWHAAEAIGGEFNVTFARVFATPRRWLADLRLPNPRFSLLVCVIMTVVESVKSKRPRYVRQLLRLLSGTVRGLPEAIRSNGRRPAERSYWE